MLVDVAYNYTAKVVLGSSRRTPRTCVYRAVGVVEIAESTEADFPLAARVAEVNPLSGRFVSLHVPYRQADGAFWRPVTGFDPISELRPHCRWPTSVKNPFADIACVKHDGDFRRNRERDFRGDLQQDAEVVEIVESGRDETALAMTRRAEDFVLMDGFLHERVPEPRLVVSFHNVGGERRASVAAKSRRGNLAAPERTFRLTDLERLPLLFDGPDGAAVKNFVAGCDRFAIVTSPDAFAYPGDEICLVAATARLAEHMAKLATNSGDTYSIAYADTRNRLAEAKAAGFAPPYSESSRRPENLDASAIHAALRHAVEQERLRLGAESSSDDPLPACTFALSRFEQGQSFDDTPALSRL